jgi:hypothetical protein
MSPFQEFRLWARRAPIGERIAAGLAAIIAVALLGWMLVPASTSSSSTLALSGNGVTAGPGQTKSTGPGATTPSAAGTSIPGGLQSASVGASGGLGGVAAGVGVGPSGVSVATNVAPGSATPGTTGCVSPPGSARGVSGSEIKIAVTLVNILGPAANSIFGIPTPAEQQADFTALIDSLNKEGGIACRKVVPQFFSANPTDQAGLQQICLNIVQSGAFAALDPGAYAVVGPMCFAQNHMPYFGGYFITQKQGNQGFPYLFDLAQFDRLFRDTIFALRDRGFFQSAKGFKKLGIIYRSCFPELIAQTIAALHQSGVQDSQIVTYSMGCPSVFASPSDVEAAVLKFKSSGVTHVTEVQDVGEMANFTAVAEQQGFRPQWGLGDDQVIGTAYGNQPPNAANMANAIIVTESRNGEERTPGLTPTPGTVKCDAWYRAHGLKPTYGQPPAAGNFCDQLLMLKAAAENAPSIGIDTLAAGLQRAKSIDFSYPEGPNDFSGTRVTTAGQDWRVAQFFTACSCWKVIDPTFHPTYQ